MLELLHAVDDQLQPGIDEVSDRGPNRLRAGGEVIRLHEEVDGFQVLLRNADRDLVCVWLRSLSPR